MWSIHNSFEFIEIGLHENLSEGWNEREKEGLPRLVEALHSQTWDCMKLKQKGDEITLGGIDRKSMLRNSTTASRESVTGSGLEDERKGREEVRDGMEEEQKETAKNLEIGADYHSAAIDSSDPELDEHLLEVADMSEFKVFEGMAQLVNEAKGIHERARDSNVSDNERREAASSATQR